MSWTILCFRFQQLVSRSLNIYNLYGFCELVRLNLKALILRAQELFDSLKEEVDDLDTIPSYRLFSLFGRKATLSLCEPVWPSDKALGW